LTILLLHHLVQPAINHFPHPSLLFAAHFFFLLSISELKDGFKKMLQDFGLWTTGSGFGDSWEPIWKQFVKALTKAVSVRIRIRIRRRRRRRESRK